MGIINRAKLVAWAAVAALSACGGGGGGGSSSASDGPAISGNFTLDGLAEVLVAGSVRAQLPDGVTGTARCALNSGSVPPGMVFGADCSLVGTPTTVGTYRSHVTLTVDGRSGSVGVDVTMRVGGPVLGMIFAPDREQRLLVPISGLSNAATVMTDGVFTQQPGDAITFEILDGALPSGVVMNASTGQVSGAPLALGSFTASVGAVLHRNGGSYRMAPVSLTLEVLAPVGNVLSYGTASQCCELIVPIGPVRTDAPRFVFPIEHLGSVRFSALSALPAGLQVDPDTGVIAGTATQVGLSLINVRATVTTVEGAVYTIDTNPNAYRLQVTGVLPTYEFSSSGDRNLNAVGGGYPTFVMQKAVRNGVTTFDPGALYGALAGDVYSYALEADAQGNTAPAWVSIDASTGRITARAPLEIQVPAPPFRFAVRVTTQRGGASFSAAQTWDLTVR